MSSKVNLHTRIPDDNVLSLTTLVSKCSLQLLTYFDNIVVSRHVRWIERGRYKEKDRERKKKERKRAKDAQTRCLSSRGLVVGLVCLHGQWWGSKNCVICPFRISTCQWGWILRWRFFFWLIYILHLLSNYYGHSLKSYSATRVMFESLSTHWLW